MGRRATGPRCALTLPGAVRSVAGVSDTPVLDAALRLWPAARDGGAVDDTDELDALLDAFGQPGAPGHDCGVSTTFACFAPDADAALTLPTGEASASDEEARLIGHIAVTRTLMAAGLGVDARVTQAMATAHALTWTTEGGGNYHTTPLALGAALWLVALDPLTGDDRPLPIDWSPGCFERDWWDPDYRLFSHYDIRERALDWAARVAREPSRHPGCSGWTIAEPLLRLGGDSRVDIALPMLTTGAESATDGGAIRAAASLERGRIAALVQAYLQSAGAGGQGGARPAPEA